MAKFANEPRKLTQRQRNGLIALTALFVFSLLGLYRLSQPNLPGLPGLLQPLAFVSSTPRSVSALPTQDPLHPELNPTQASRPWYGSGTPQLGEAPGPASTPTAFLNFFPFVRRSMPQSAYVFERTTEPPAPPPTPAWPNGRSSLTGSKLGLHVVQNNDPFIMEYVRRVRPRVMKAVDDVGWLADVKAVSPNTITIGRFEGQDETWPETKDPVAAAREYVAMHLERYRLNPGVDYWEGWNEFVPTTTARWQWFTQFEAARACEMQAMGLKAAIGGFVGGAPELDQMAMFVPALETARGCGAIFTLHEGVSPLFNCGVFMNQPNVIPGSPAIPDKLVGFLMLRYRFWYELYLKPRGAGDIPLVISELAVGGIVPGQDCNGPGGADWRPYEDFWIQNGIGPDGPQAYVNLLAWYDSEMRKDPYVLGATIFTAGAVNSGDRWNHADVHDVIIPLAYYAVQQD